MNGDANHGRESTHSLRTKRASLAVWRSPGNQPAWARPALLFLTALAGVLYSWDATGNLEIYYAAAVRSMAMSWHNFFFAAFDPAGTISLDKLPGAFWVQALCARVFGVHAWVIVAPQVVEGMASVSSSTEPSAVWPVRSLASLPLLSSCSPPRRSRWTAGTSPTP